MAPAPGPPKDASAALSGFTVGVTAERSWQDQSEILGRLGARVVHAPVVAPLSPIQREALESVVDDLLQRPPLAVVLPTAEALDSWLAAAEYLDRVQALGQLTDDARVVVGGGAAPAARGAGLDTVAELEEAPGAGVCGQLRIEAGGERRIAVQLGHPSADELAAGLRADGCDVVGVPPCPRDLPEDLRPGLALVEAVIERRVDAVTFTETAQVRNLVAIAASDARNEALLEALDDGVVVACMGLRCTAAAEAAGMRDVVQAASYRTGAMLEALTERLGAAVVRVALNGVDVEIRGLLALVGGEEVWLTERERGVLAMLARRPGVVVPKAELLRRVWCSNGVDGADGHAVEVAVGRLRRRLGAAGPGLVTVPRRGYRLSPD